MHRALAILTLVLLLGGCESELPRAKIKGTVTFDGKPLEEGTVQFISTENKTPSSAAPVKDGTYEADVYQGKMRVQVSALQTVGKRKRYETPDSPMIDVKKERIPERYNAKSELTRDIGPGENVANFDLKSK